MNHFQYHPSIISIEQDHPLDNICGFTAGESLEDQASSSASNLCIPFPWKLHKLLATAEIEGLEAIVSWIPQDNAFRVHDQKAFLGKLMPRYFKQTKYKSFQRQLNIWGFERIQRGSCKGAYRHASFVRGKPSMCRHMRRQKIKGTSSFYSLSKICAASTTIPTPAITATPLILPQIISATILRIAAVSPMSRPVAPDQINSSNLKFHHNQAKNERNVPEDGDCVLFAGRNFFFVTDNEPQEPKGKQRDHRFSFDSPTQTRRFSLKPLLLPIVDDN